MHFYYAEVEGTYRFWVCPSSLSSPVNPVTKDLEFGMWFAFEILEDPYFFSFRKIQGARVSFCESYFLFQLLIK